MARDSTPPDRSAELGFAPLDDVPIPYLQRIRDYYAGLGYGAPYVFAHYRDVPFAPLAKPLSACRIAVVTTAAPFKAGRVARGERAPYAADAKFFSVYSAPTDLDHDLTIFHVAIDRDHTTGEDQGTFMPLAALRRAAKAGRIAGLAPRFHGAPTNRSHRTTLEVDVPEVVARCREDAVDAVLLVPNCPVCHQTMCLAARALEAAGIPTVVMGCAKDIVEHVGVPRMLFSDFPLGNGCGRPNDTASQDTTLELALRLLESAPGPRTTLQSPLRWREDHDWKLDYSNIARLSADEIACRRAEFDGVKAAAKAMKASQ